MAGYGNQGSNDGSNFPRRNTRSRISGIDASESSDSEQHGENTYYAGGERSGIAIQGRPTSDHTSMVESILRQARSSSSSPEGPSLPEAESHYLGTGNRLGNTGNEENAAQNVDRRTNLETGITQQANLVIWRNGFTICNVFHNYTSIEGQRLLADIQNGWINGELVGGSQNVELRVIRKENMDFTPILEKFSTGGNSLAPSQRNSEEIRVVAVNADNSSPKLATVNEEKPVTRLQFRHENGTRLVARFNPDHTVGEARSHFAAMASETRQFLLMYGQSLLTDETKTLEEAGILDSSVIPRFV